MLRAIPLVIVVGGLAGCGGNDQVAPVLSKGPSLRLVQVASALKSPVQVIATPSEPDRLYVVEQDGRVRVLIGRRLRPEPFLDIRHLVKSGGEQGLLAVAFHPNYDLNGRFFVHHTNREGNTRVAEYRATGKRAAHDSRRELLAVDQPYENHQGGQLAFGPDGLLYLGLGDGGDARDPEDRSQNPSTKLGKLLRLDVDRPLARWEIVGIGLRNPWRFSFDEETNVLYIADVGQERWEEVNAVPMPFEGMLNFGWDVYEGFEPFEDKDPTPPTALVEPILVYSHAEGCSVIGGFVYRGEEIRSLRDRYVFGDYCAGTIWSFSSADGRRPVRRVETIAVPQLTSFGEDSLGRMLLVSQTGTIYRIANRTAVPASRTPN